MIPVVFIHYGVIPDYLKTAIKQAVSRGNKVFLITDDASTLTEAQKVLIDYINEEAEAFSGVYRHLSKNPEEFELRCFQRWGLLKRFMERESLSKVFYCDSDVMLYVNVSAELMDTELSYSVPVEQPPFRWSASAHVSVFSYENLCELWKFMMVVYTEHSEAFKQLKEKYKHHLSSGAPGGVCDMTLLYLFSETKEITPLCQVLDGITFDHNINSSENSIKNEYEMREVAGPYGPMLIKNIKLVNKTPCCFNLDLGQTVKFNSLHFQGGAKTFMHQFQC
jgi:hypothetical protein